LSLRAPERARARRRIGHAAPGVPPPDLDVRGPRPLHPHAPRLMMLSRATPEHIPLGPPTKTPWPCHQPAGRTPRRVPRRRRPRASVAARRPLNSPPLAPRHSLLTLMHSPAYKRASRAPPHAHAAPPTANVAVAASTSARPLSPPRKRLGTFPRTYGSCHGCLFACIRPPLAGTRAGVEAPPRPRCRRPPAASPTQPPPRIDLW
jgi:hypothetical protein